jgi:hypothetical protein
MSHAPGLERLTRYVPGGGPSPELRRRGASLAAPLPDGDPAAVQHRGLGLGALEIERDGSLPQQSAGANPASGWGLKKTDMWVPHVSEVRGEGKPVHTKVR